MRIYNEVVLQWDDNTQQFNTLYEDYEEYTGQVALAQGLPPNATPVSAQDTITDTIKTTAGYFTGGDGTLSGTDIFTGSLADSNQKYYFNINNLISTNASSETQFSVTFGHAAGSGSNQYGDSSTNASNLRGETQAIYKQFTNILLEETEAVGGFKISQQGSSGQLGSGVKDEYVYIWIGKRARFKDRPNKKTWTMVLSGSNELAAPAKLSLTDDSNTTAATATPAGPRHNIVSGALGKVKHAATVRTYGWFYPEMGCMIFSGAELSASATGIPGKPPTSPGVVGFRSGSQLGFAIYGSGTVNEQNALRFANCLRHVGGVNTLRLRSEEDATQENYFCRIKAQDYNFSANPTFSSGSDHKVRHVSMHGNPQTFITGIGLYNSAGNLLAIAQLSKPLLKNFASEATIKVKLTY